MTPETAHNTAHGLASSRDSVNRSPLLPRALKTLVSTLLVYLGVAQAVMAGKPPEKWFIVEDAVNKEPAFMLRVAVDHADRTYREGEQMVVSICSERDCYLYLIYYSAGDQVACLFPNRYQQENFVRAGEVVDIPGPGADFQFTAAPPLGQEMLQVIGSLEPLDSIAIEKLTKGTVTALGEQDLKDMVVELKGKRKPRWAEARIDITTVPGKHGKPRPGQSQSQAQSPTQGQGQSQRQGQSQGQGQWQGQSQSQGQGQGQQSGQTGKRGKRYAVCVGISQYEHDRVPDLKVSHLDGENMARALRDLGGVDEVVLLTDERATRQAIEQAIFRDLAAKAAPGDTVLIFFSCHGGRTADTNGDEQDGVDEYLVPHDGRLGSPETMILDDTFARWMQELDGCRVGIMLDNCYSGGSSKGTKGIGDAPIDAPSVDFFDGEFKRAKDLGQVGTMVIAACRADQVAWERPEPGEGSVLTYNLLKALADATSDVNGDGRLSLGEAFRFVDQPVRDYVRQTFNAEQTPVLIDNANDGVLLRPY